MANQLNDNDFQVFGMYLMKGALDAFLEFPERKESLSNDFDDKDGRNIDLAAPKFQARQFTVPVAIIAKGDDVEECYQNFWNQYNGLFTELAKPFLHDFYFDDHQRHYKLYYLRSQNATKLSRISGQLKVGLTIELVLTETNPFQNIQKIYLVDEQGRRLIA